MGQKATIILDLDDVEYSTKIEFSDIPVKGNVQASEDDEADEAAENEVLAEIANGNVYAWCDIIVYATLGGFDGLASLGAVSCKTEEEVEATIADHGMREEALEDLKRNMKLLGAIFE